jgi:hypothetical protein
MNRRRPCAQKSCLSIIRRGALVALVVLTVASCATTRSSDALVAWQNDTRAALQRQDDVASRVASAILLDWPLGPVTPLDPRVVQEIGDAAALMPEDRRVATLRVVTCIRTAGCDTAEAAAALRRVDPGNGIADWPALEAAVASDDAAAIDDAMRTLSTAERFDVYFTPTVVSMADALVRSGAAKTPGGRPARDAGRWALTAIGALSVRGVPPYGTLGTACRAPDLPPVRRQHCLKALATLLQSDTLILQSLASGLTLRLAELNSPEAAAANAWRRAFEWRSLQQDKLLKPFRVRNFLRENLAALRANRREEDAVRALLVAFNLPPDPPANWTPPTRTPAR